MIDGVGYSHSYSLLGVEMEEIKSRQKPMNLCNDYGLFEMRTEFKFCDDRKRNRIMGSERFDVVCLGIGIKEGKGVERKLKWRLEEYWMSEDEMQKLLEETVELWRQQRRRAREPGCVGLIIRMEVVTVQREGETLDEAKMRAVLPGKLTPLHVWRHQTMVRREMSLDLMDLLFNLGRRRPEPKHDGEDDDDDDDDHVCSICLITQFNGAFITKLEHCGCVFHSYCIIRKLERDNKCPHCRHQVYDATLLTAHSEEEWWWDDNEDDDLYFYGVRSY